MNSRLQAVRQTGLNLEFLLPKRRYGEIPD
jgi:hypothetical protein